METQRTIETVTRYVITYIGRDGLRTLIGPAQGRHTYATEEDAREMLNAVLGNNSYGTITDVYGSNPQFEVRSCECYAGHFDPIGVYFD